MNYLISTLCFINASWMTIYLYGLHAVDDTRYQSGLIIFPVILFILALYPIAKYLYKDYKNIAKKNDTDIN